MCDFCQLLMYKGEGGVGWTPSRLTLIEVEVHGKSVFPVTRRSRWCKVLRLISEIICWSLMSGQRSQTAVWFFENCFEQGALEQYFGLNRVSLSRWIKTFIFRPTKGQGKIFTSDDHSCDLKAKLLTGEFNICILPMYLNLLNTMRPSTSLYLVSVRSYTQKMHVNFIWPEMTLKKVFDPSCISITTISLI